MGVDYLGFLKTLDLNKLGDFNSFSKFIKSVKQIVGPISVVLFAGFGVILDISFSPILSVIYPLMALLFIWGDDKDGVLR